MERGNKNGVYITKRKSKLQSNALERITQVKSHNINTHLKKKTKHKVMAFSQPPTNKTSAAILRIKQSSSDTKAFQTPHKYTT